MELVAAALGRVIDGGAGLTSVLAGVAVGDNSDFLHFILAEEQIAGAGVVEVQKGIVFVVAIFGEEIRSGGQTKGGKVSVSATAGVHRDTGSDVGEVGDVATWVRQLLHDATIDSGCDVGIFGLQHRSFAADFDGGLAAANGEGGRSVGDLTEIDVEVAVDATER